MTPYRPIRKKHIPIDSIEIELSIEVVQAEFQK